MMTVFSACTACVSDVLGQSGIYWSRHTEAPYLRGTPAVDYDGPYDSEEEAVKELKAIYPNAVYLGSYPASSYVEEKELFWRTVEALYEVSFWLPLDELSDQFDADALYGCPTAESLTQFVKVQHEPNPAELILHSIEPAPHCFLMCDAVVRNPQDDYGPHTEMHLVMKVRFSKPERLQEEDVFQNAHFKVTIPPYFEEPMFANLKFWDSLPSK